MTILIFPKLPLLKNLTNYACLLCKFSNYFISSIVIVQCNCSAQISKRYLRTSPFCVVFSYSLNKVKVEFQISIISELNKEFPAI